MQFVLVLLILGAVVSFVLAPLRDGTRGQEDELLRARRAELEAAKEAKYHEIRDAELDYRTGKLSEADWRGMDRTLRAEAVELLKELDLVAARGEPLP